MHKGSKLPQESYFNVCSFNPLNPNIKMHIPLTTPIYFFMTLVERICMNIKTLPWLIISFILITSTFDQVVILYGEIICWSVLGLKGLKVNFMNYQISFTSRQYLLGVTKTLPSSVLFQKYPLDIM